MIFLHALVEKLTTEHRLSKDECLRLLLGRTPELQALLAQKARACCKEHYGKDVYLRGLIEFTNYCKNNCYYCGLRCENSRVTRYRLTEEEILSCCRQGYALGLRTFVLQGGEDPHFTPEKIANLVREIKQEFPDCAVTLSVGEHSRETYKLWREAGADRYLLRHETADADHYCLLHPETMSLAHRKQCLCDLKDLGYQVGAGMMVGSPHQTLEHLAEDLNFLQELRPHMVGIGPFIPQKDTPFGGKAAGSVDMTLYLLSILRLLLPQTLLPATTALGSLQEDGREQGILAGANVCMPNLSPASLREHYAIYDHKLSVGAESAEAIQSLKERLSAIDRQAVCHRGDSLLKG